MNLALIGFSGSGKSYLGRKLAKELGLEFVDLDEVMEGEYGKSLPEMLETLGDEGFIAFESESARRRTHGQSRLLISIGGSIIYAPEAVEHLRAISTVIYLDVPFETIESRIGGSVNRLGRIVGLGNKTLSDLYADRDPLYRQYAHHTISPEEMTLENMYALVRGL